jgi:glucose dehydrogenase
VIPSWCWGGICSTGAQLWRGSVGGQVVAGPMTYRVNNTQYVATAAVNAMFAFALPQ